MAPKQRPLREMALFAGAGGGILGGLLLGWETICAVEINAFCARRLMQRQNEDYLPPFPIWDDVSTFNGRSWRGRVDVVSGGFPCQGISAANQNATGLDDPRSGLWSEQRRIIEEIRPPYAFVENSPMLIHRGLVTILSDFAEMGYDARWGVIPACSIGAEHERERLFIVGHSDMRRQPGSAKHDETSGLSRISSPDTNGTQRKGRKLSGRTKQKYSPSSYPRWGKDKPGVDRMANGLANQLERLHAIGNGQVPGVVKLAWETLSQ